MYQLFCDSNTDLPLDLVQKYHLQPVQMPYVLKDEEYKHDLTKAMDFKEFYRIIREGNMPSTSALNVQDYIDFFEPVLAQGTDVLMLCFSFALSCTFQSMEKAREELLEKYPDRIFEMVNTRAISMGDGILVQKAAQLWQEGKDLYAVKEWVEQNQNNMQHWFTVDDLNHLRRGGRISGAAAVVGTLLEVKPILMVNQEGKIVVFEKVKGRKKALKAMAEQFFENAVAPENELISILHADSVEDANYLAGLLKEKYTLNNLRIDMVGPVVGSHCGPGTIGLCFMGKPRKP